MLFRRIKVKLGKFKITYDYIYGNHPDGILRKKLSEFSTTYVAESEYNNENIIYPNPATDYITINFSYKGLKPFASNEVKVEIYDVMGVLIHSTPVETNTSTTLSNRFSSLHNIDIFNLASGIYFVKIVGSNGACSIVEKFVKY